MIKFQRLTNRHSSNLPWQFVKFAVAGATGTAAHYLVLIWLVESFDMSPLTASVAGFATGAVVNYLLARKFVFADTRSIAITLPRFALVALFGAMVNAAFLSWMLDYRVHYLVAQAVATLAVLVANFALNKLWTFSQR